MPNLKVGGIYREKETGELALLLNYDIDKVRVFKFFKDPPTFQTIGRTEFFQDYLQEKDSPELVTHALSKWNNLRTQSNLKKISYEEFFYGNLCKYATE